MDEITDKVARLPQALAEAEDRALEERLRCEELQRQRKEISGSAAQPTQLQILVPYLEACHSLSLAIRAIPGRPSTTQSDITNPVGRIFPRRIVPWNDFLASQEDIWSLLSDPSFTSQHIFPSKHLLDHARSNIRPISSDDCKIALASMEL